MSFTPFPRGDARTIADARAKGMKPAGAVEIILAGDWTEGANPKVFADADKPYRWEWVKGLPVVLMIDATTSLDRILTDINAEEPSQIDVIDRERCLGWLVTCVTPTVQTVRWPRAWVQDWLMDRGWHQALAQVKANALETSKAKKQAETKTEQEVVWN